MDPHDQGLLLHDLSTRSRPGHLLNLGVSSSSPHMDDSQQYYDMDKQLQEGLR